MAGEAEVIKDNKTAEDEGSLAQILEEQGPGVPVFTGHPALGEEEATPGLEGEGGIPEGAKPPEEEGKEKPPESKFKTKEEAERAHAEAERRMHEATTQAAKDKEARETAEREREQLRQELEGLKTRIPEKPPEETSKPPVTKEGRKTRLKSVSKAAFDRIAQLDRTDPDYQEQVANVWADLLEAVAVEPSSLTPDEIAKITRDTIKAEREAQEAADAAEGRARVWQKAVDIATKAGLNMEADSADFILFTALARRAPDDLYEKPLQEQVDWVVAEVRKRKDQMIQLTKGEEEAIRKAQEKNAILERGSRTPKSAPKEEAYSLKGILEEKQQERRI